MECEKCETVKKAEAVAIEGGADRCLKEGHDIKNDSGKTSLVRLLEPARIEVFACGRCGAEYGFALCTCCNDQIEVVLDAIQMESAQQLAIEAAKV